MAISDNSKIVEQASTRESHHSSTLEAEILEAEIVSQTPGRIRLRIIPPHRQLQKMTPIAQALKARLEIYRVKTNISTGSITIFYGRELLSSQDMFVILQDLGVHLVTITHQSRISVSGSSSAATEVIQTATDLNRRVQTVTNDAVDLRFLVPLSFACLAMRQLFIKGWQLEFIPWYVLAWYAFDSFLKLNYPTNLSNSKT